MKLIENWSQSWRWISMQATAARGAAEGAFVASIALLNENQRAAVIGFVSAHITVVFVGMFAISFLQGFGRLVQQTPPKDPPQ